MRLTRDVSLVGSGNTGFYLSSDHDCHCYLIDGGSELALIDLGLGGPLGNSRKILTNIDEDGFDRAKIGKLLVTHYHPDHLGAAHEMSELLGGIDVHGSPLCIDVLARADAEAISLPRVQAIGLYPREFVFEAHQGIPSLIEGSTFPVGSLTVTVYETPGHSAGHVSLLVEGGERTYLFGGDLVFWGGKIGLQNNYDCSVQEYQNSVHKLADLNFDALLPGHFMLVLRDGKQHVAAAAAAFNGLLTPPNAP